MKTIEHLPAPERTNYIQCSLCDEYYDPRDYEQVKKHEHTMEQPAVTTDSNKSLEK